MLILRRKEGDWVEIRDKAGNMIAIRVYNIRHRGVGQCELAFDDPDHKQIGLLRTATQTPDAFTLGTFNGQINAVGMITELSFMDMVAFYGTEEEQEEPDAT